jgi:hypothetical protein
VTKLAFVADVHLGNHKIHGGSSVCSLNERCRAGIEVFGRAVKRAVEARCSAFFVLGDLLDYSRPEAQLLAALQRILRRAHDGGMNFWIVAGNHEMTSGTPGDHALGPLSPYASIVDKPMLVKPARDIGVGLIPYRAGNEPAKLWMPEAVQEALREGPDSGIEHRILGIHLGVSDDKTPPWLAGSPGSIDVHQLVKLAGALGVTRVFAGDWHDRRRWNFIPSVFQLGALVPTGWDNPGLEGYGTLAIWNDGQVDYHEIPGPRFIGTVPDDAAALVAEAKKLGHQPFLRLTTSPDELGEARAALEALGVPGDVRADMTDVTVAARTAATAARSATTLDEALGGFVANMVLPEGVEREQVAALALRYLRGGEVGRPA